MDTLENTIGVTGYETLGNVLHRAYTQAASGKGNERHADGEPFNEQPMQTISALVGSDGGLLFQAIKKIHESQRLNHAAGIAELLGAINYIAGAIIYREAHAEKAIAKVEEPLLRRASDRYFLSGGTAEMSEKYVADLNLQAEKLKAQQAAAKLAKVRGDGSGKALPEIQIAPANDGFITWGGGACPVPPENIVLYKMRDDFVACKNKAKDLRWDHEGTLSDIVAYKPAPTCNCGMLPAGACLHGVSCNDG